jgi:hypothetical protein
MMAATELSRFGKEGLARSGGVLLELAKPFALPTMLSVVPEGEKAPALFPSCIYFDRKGLLKRYDYHVEISGGIGAVRLLLRS